VHSCTGGGTNEPRAKLRPGAELTCSQVTSITRSSSPARDVSSIGGQGGIVVVGVGVGDSSCTTSSASIAQRAVNIGLLVPQ
jgi:hypothetical protein